VQLVPLVLKELTATKEQPEALVTQALLEHLELLVPQVVKEAQDTSVIMESQEHAVLMVLKEFLVLTLKLVLLEFQDQLVSEEKPDLKV